MVSGEACFSRKQERDNESMSSDGTTGTTMVGVLLIDKRDQAD
jgi:hypothetical protein